MKKTQFIDAVKNIKNRLPSFLSVILVVAIGTGGFFTTQNIYRSLDTTFNDVYEKQNFMDLDLVSSGGVVEEDIEAVRKLASVEEAEGVIKISGELSDKGNRYNVEILSLTEKVSVPALLEGSLPVKQNEVAINQDLAMETGIGIGDKVTIRNLSNLDSDPLKEESFTVTAIVRHPDYLRKAKTWMVVLPLSAFDLKATNDSYTDMYVSGKEDVEDEVWKLLPTLGSQTTLRVRDQAEDIIQEKTDEINEQLKQAEEELGKKEDEATAQLASAEKQLSDFESLFVDGRQQIEDAKKQLDEAYVRLTDAEAQIASGQSQLNKAKQAYRQIEEELGPIKENIGQDITGKELLTILETLETALDGFKSALESGDQEQILWTLDFLLEALDNETVLKFLESSETTDDIIDTNALLEMITDKKVILNDIINEQTEEAVAFLKYFTEEGLRNYLQRLEPYLDDLAAAIATGSQEGIEQAQANIEALISEKNSLVIDGLLYRYSFYSLDEFLDNIQNVETEITLKDMEYKLNTAIAELSATDSLPVSHQKAFINTAINHLGSLAKDYAQAVAEDDQEMIGMVDGWIDDCLADVEIRETLAVIEVMSGKNIEAFIAEVRSGDLTVDQVEAIVEEIKEAVINSDDNPPASFIPSYVVPLLKGAKDIIQMTIALPENYSDQSYQDLTDAIDVLTDNAYFYVVMEAIEEIYGFSFLDIMQPIYDLNTYIELIQVSAQRMIEYLIDETYFFDEFPVATVREMLGDYLQSLEQLEENINNQDNPQAFKDLKAVIHIMSDYDFKFIEELINDYFDEDIGLDLTRIIPIEKIETLQEKLHELDEPIRLYAQLEKQIEDGERALNAARSEVAAGWEAYYAGLKQLKEKERLLNASASEIASARTQLEQNRQEALSALEEARNEITKARKEAEDEIARNREEILNRNYNWVALNRDTNISYADTRGPVQGSKGSSMAFGALFFMVIALVCFSTIAIIVEEEKKSVGTTKAFGFYNREILGKYLVFGLSASFIGCILGSILGFVVCRLVLNYFENTDLYILDGYTIKTSPLTMILAAVIVMALCALATYLACTDLLKSPAALLMKGETISTRNRKNKKQELRTDKPKKSLYSRLITRNIINEKERVAITVFIVAISCFCTGIGITLRDGFTGMIERQKSEIYLYDFRIDYTKDVSEDELKQIETILSQNDASYLNAYYGTHLFEKDQKNNALYIVAADDDRLNSFIAVKDPKTGKQLTLPHEGVLVQLRLDESYGISPNTDLTLYDSQLNTHEAHIVSCFQNYQGRLVIASKEAYAGIFHKDAENNCYFVRLGKNNYDTVYDLLSDFDNIAIEKADSYKQAFETAIGLFNIIIILMTLMSVLMSFMILTNLANIYITRKKKELIVMRINGFSIKETIRYLAKETILTTLMGVGLAIVLGFFFGIIPIRVLEQPDAQFVRSFNLKAWIIAVILECLFSFIINSMVFKKVKKLNFREVL